MSSNTQSINSAEMEVLVCIGSVEKWNNQNDIGSKLITHQEVSNETYEEY